VFHARHGEVVHARVTGYVQARIQDGAFRPVDARTAALGYLSLVWQTAVERFVFKTREHDQQPEHYLRTLTDIYLAGLKRSP
jgi:hypothetical protein